MPKPTNAFDQRDRISVGELKKTLMDAIKGHLERDAAMSTLDVEIQRVGNLQIQVRIKDNPDTPPYYFNVKVSGEL